MTNYFTIESLPVTTSEKEQIARLEQARLQGETVFEFTIPVTVRVDVGFLFFRPDFAAESYAGRELGQLARTTVTRMHEEHPECIADVNEFFAIQLELYRMIEDIRDEEDIFRVRGNKKSSTFNLDRARTGLARMRKILQRWGVKEQERFEVLKKVFGYVGETLE